MEQKTDLSLKLRVGYALGDMGGSMVFQTVTLFILYFFTDVFGIAAASAGWILAAAKVWNSVCDPLMGYVSDRTNTRYGTKRPFLLFGAIPLGIAFFLLFFAPDLSPTMKIVYGLITFLMFSTAYSAVGVPYGALTAIVARDDRSRSELTAWRMSFAILAILVIAGITKPIVGLFPSAREGWHVIGITYGIAAVLMTWVTFSVTREDAGEKRIDTAPFKKTFKAAFANAPFLILTGTIILHLTAINLLASMVNYFFKYNLKNETAVTIAFLCLFVSAAAALPLWLKLGARMERKNAFNIGMAVIAFVLVSMFLFKDAPLPVIFGLFVLAGIGMSTVYLFPWSMIPETIDYSDRTFDLRIGGFLYGIFYFAFKASAALAGLIAGQGLSLAGYAANADQSNSALNGIRLLMTIIPAGLIVLGIILCHFYRVPDTGKGKSA